jgi:hypothetical protein
MPEFQGRYGGTVMDHWPYHLLWLAGFDLRADGGTLRVSPAEDITEGTADFIRLNKPSLLDTLAEIEAAKVDIETWNAAVKTKKKKVKR